MSTRRIIKLNAMQAVAIQTEGKQVQGFALIGGVVVANRAVDLQTAIAIRDALNMAIQGVEFNMATTVQPR